VDPTAQSRAGTRRTQQIGPAKSIWKKIDTYGRRLLAARTALQMDEWLEVHQEYRHVETSGFFEELGTNEMGWGSELQNILAWCEKTGAPFGFSKCMEDAEHESGIREFVLEDVIKDVRAMLVRTNEVLTKSQFDPNATEPLSEQFQAVLDLISAKPMTGKEIIDALKDTKHRVDRGTLTSRIIPHLKAYYHVERGPSGYFCRNRM
jgi:hypothetical protein